MISFNYHNKPEKEVVFPSLYLQTRDLEVQGLRVMKPVTAEIH